MSTKPTEPERAATPDVVVENLRSAVHASEAVDTAAPAAAPLVVKATHPLFIIQKSHSNHQSVCATRGRKRMDAAARGLRPRRPGDQSAGEGLGAMAPLAALQVGIWGEWPVSGRDRRDLSLAGMPLAALSAKVVSRAGKPRGETTHVGDAPAGACMRCACARRRSRNPAVLPHVPFSSFHPPADPA